MQKTVVRNPNQSSIRRNLLNIAGITVQGETITPSNGDRLLGGYGVAWLNNQDAASQTTGQDNPLPECNCESGGGGGGGSGGGGGGVPPSGNCEKKNISELKQVLDDYANQSFCDKEFPEVQFSTFIGYDKPPSNSTAKEIELRMLCPVDDCSDGTFWSPGYSTPTNEAIYNGNILGYSDTCTEHGRPQMIVRKMTPCEIFENHKAYLKQQIENFEAPCECSEFQWNAQVLNYNNPNRYFKYGDGLPPPEIIDEACAFSMSVSSYPYYQNDATFTIYCKSDSSCMPNGYRFSFGPNNYINRYYEDTCQGVRCPLGANECAENCHNTYERIFEQCCIHD